MKHSKFKLAQEAIKHKGFLQKIPAAVRMIKSWRKGEYKMKVTDILNVSNKQTNVTIQSNFCVFIILQLQILI